MMSKVLLSIEDLKVHFTSYEGTAKIINGVNIHLNEGEVISIVGESGCGKSVTVRSILGLVPTPPAKYVGGEIIFENRNILKFTKDEMQKMRGQDISMIFQDPMTALNPVFTIGEQLMDVYMWKGKKRNILSRVNKKLKQEAYSRAIEVLEKMRIPDPAAIMKRYPVELSGGMRQRIVIAMALMHTPKLLIADEPGTALDVSVQDQILVELKRLVKEEGISMIFITHNLGVARIISDRVYVMYAGEVVEEGDAKTIFEESYHPYTNGLLASIPKLDGSMGEGIDGRIPNFLNAPVGCRFYERCTERKSVCKDTRPDLIGLLKNRKVACHLYVEGGN